MTKATLLTFSDSFLYSRTRQKEKEISKTSTINDVNTTSRERLDAVLRVESINQTFALYKDVWLKSISISNLADLLWNEDNAYARQLFVKAKDFADAPANELSPEIKACRRNGSNNFFVEKTFLDCWQT